MALINCSECGKEISDKAQSCPNCGTPISAAKTASLAEPSSQAPKKSGKWKYILLGFVVLAVIGSFVGEKDDKAPSETSQTDALPVDASKPKQPKSDDDPCKNIKTMDDWNNKTSALWRTANPQCKPDESKQNYEVISASALFNEFKRNEVAAKQRFLKKRVAIEGRIHSIDSSPLGYPEIVFDVGNYGLDTVKCQFPKNTIDTIANMSKGQRVVVIGTVRSFVMKSLVSLDDCVFGTVKK